MWRPNIEQGSLIPATNIQNTAIIRSLILMEDSQGSGFGVRIRLFLGRVLNKTTSANKDQEGLRLRLAERQLTHGHLMALFRRFQRAGHGAICGRRQERHCESFPLADLLLQSVSTRLSVSRRKEIPLGRCIFIRLSKPNRKS